MNNKLNIEELQEKVKVFINDIGFGSGIIAYTDNKAVVALQYKDGTYDRHSLLGVSCGDNDFTGDQVGDWMRKLKEDSILDWTDTEVWWCITSPEIIDTLRKNKCEPTDLIVYFENMQSKFSEDIKKYVKTVRV